MTAPSSTARPTKPTDRWKWAIRAARHLTPSEALVLSALVWWDIGGTTSYPGRKQLLEDTGLPLETLKGAMRGLKTKGWIAKAGGGYFSRNAEYTITYAKGVDPDQPHSGPAKGLNSTAKGLNSTGKGVEFGGKGVDPDQPPSGISSRIPSGIPSRPSASASQQDAALAGGDDETIDDGERAAADAPRSPKRKREDGLSGEALADERRRQLAALAAKVGGKQASVGPRRASECTA